jgi:hypothetical protein
MVTQNETIAPHAFNKPQQGKFDLKRGTCALTSNIWHKVELPLDLLSNI